MVYVLSKSILLVVLLSVSPASYSAFAQNKATETEKSKDSAVEITIKPVSTTTPTLNELFARLSKVKDAGEAKGVADQIEHIWAKSGSDTADLLMGRVDVALQARQYNVALDLVDSVIALEPKWADAWNKRATILFLQNDFDGSMRDIRQVLILEPRHYLAIGGISLIYQGMDNKKLALKAARQALEIYPFMSGIKDYIDTTARSVEGNNL